MPFTKQINSFAFAVIFLLLFFSCNREDADISIPVETAYTGFLNDEAKPITEENEFIQYLSTIGYKKDDIWHNKDFYIIGQDMLYPKSDVASFLELMSRSEKQRRSTYTASYALIYYHIKNPHNGNTFNSEWRNAIRNAFSEYNTMSSNKLFFEEISSASLADIVVYPYSACGSAIGGSAVLPTSNGDPGGTINLNICASPTSERKFYVTFHEIGHTIGLHHTDGSAGTFIPGSCTVDNRSVMNASQTSITEITPCDDYSIGYLYPANECIPDPSYSDWLIQPNGGERFTEQEDQILISWDPQAIAWSTQVRLQMYYLNNYMRHGGINSGPILDITTANDGSYTWDLPGFSIIGDGFRIKVSAPGNDCIADFSDNYFRIDNY